MQYIGVGIPQEKEEAIRLIDANEFYLLNMFFSDRNIPVEEIIKKTNSYVIEQPNEKDMKLAVVYGKYFNQYGYDFNELEVRSNMAFHLNKWLINLSGEKVSYLKILDFEIIRVTSVLTCSHCTGKEHQHINNNPVFSALALISDDIEIRQRGQAVTAFYHDSENLIDSILNRLGFFAIASQERRAKNLDQMNRNFWKYYIDRKRAIKNADKIQ